MYACSVSKIERKRLNLLISNFLPKGRGTEPMIPVTVNRARRYVAD